MLTPEVQSYRFIVVIVGNDVISTAIGIINTNILSSSDSKVFVWSNKSPNLIYSGSDHIVNNWAAAFCLTSIDHHLRENFK